MNALDQSPEDSLKADHIVAFDKMQLRVLQFLSAFPSAVELAWVTWKIIIFSLSFKLLHKNSTPSLCMHRTPNCTFLLLDWEELNGPVIFFSRIYNSCACKQTQVYQDVRDATWYPGSWYLQDVVFKAHVMNLQWILSGICLFSNSTAPTQQ